jgi:hypothetical protein
MAGGGLGQDLPQLEGREDGADLRQEADDHQDGVRHQEAPDVGFSLNYPGMIFLPKVCYIIPRYVLSYK